MPASPVEDEDEEELDDDANPKRAFLFFQAAPAWLISTLVHVLILLVLGLVTLADPTQIVNVLTANNSGEDGPEIEEFTIEKIDPGDVAEMEEITEPVDVAETMEMVEPTTPAAGARSSDTSAAIVNVAVWSTSAVPKLRFPRLSEQFPPVSIVQVAATLRLRVPSRSKTTALYGITHSPLRFFMNSSTETFLTNLVVYR